jgi:hypothetical protein
LIYSERLQLEGIMSETPARIAVRFSESAAQQSLDTPSSVESDELLTILNTVRKRIGTPQRDQLKKAADEDAVIRLDLSSEDKPNDSSPEQWVLSVPRTASRRLSTA